MKLTDSELNIIESLRRSKVEGQSTFLTIRNVPIGDGHIQQVYTGKSLTVNQLTTPLYKFLKEAQSQSHKTPQLYVIFYDPTGFVQAVQGLSSHQ